MSNAELSNIQRMIVQLPFAGFYNSMHDARLDDAQEMDAEHLVSADNENYPEAVGMEVSEINDVLHNLADWSKAHDKYARDYVTAFAGYVKQETGMDLGLEFEKMESPKEYNFDTDRIFAYIPATVLGTIKAAVTLENLQAVINERHESRSGFYSFYTTDIEEWNAKPLADWDHNELCTLLIAWMRQEMADDADEAINEKVIDFDSEIGSDAWQACCDWSKLDENCKEYKEKHHDRAE